MMTTTTQRLRLVLLAAAIVYSFGFSAPHRAQNCAGTSVGFMPLSESGSYQGVPLGLYPGESNTPPSAHLAAGIQIANAIRPVNGKYLLISIGMSNTSLESQSFANLGPAPNPKLKFVNGAQAGMAAENWSDVNCPCWAVLDSRITAAGLTGAQVVSAWVKLTTRFPNGGWPNETTKLRAATRVVMQLLASRFPNLKIVHLSSRIYAGYSTTLLSPEPYAYESGFAVRGVIEDQLNGLLPYAGPSRIAPWIAWGPYLWSDGLVPRSDGLTWACSDFQSDGTHPSLSGSLKVADRLRSFFLSDPAATPWFVGN